MIIRKVIKTSFTTISNSILQNKNLSLKAKGLLCLCLSLPDDWDFNKRGIQTFSTDGRESIETSIKELKREHYLIINKIMPSKDNPKIDYEWVVYEEPYQDTGFTPIEQDTGFQDTDFQDTENPQLQNTNIQITKNKIKKESKKEKGVSPEVSYNDVIDNFVLEKELNKTMKEWVKARIFKKDKVTNYAVELACKKVLKMPIEKQILSVEESIIRGWSGIFEIKDSNLKDKAREAYIKDVEYKTKQKETAQQRDDRNLKVIEERGKEILERWNNDNRGNNKISETNKNGITDGANSRN